jgi:hypothetical protein
MRCPAAIPFDGMKFPLTLAGQLRAAFADVVSTPLPPSLSALMSRLSADRDESFLEDPNHGATTTKTSGRIDR